MSFVKPQDDGQQALQHEITRCWPLALGHWSQFLLLGRPILDCEQPSIAQIDLATRQVALNHRMILDKKLTGSVEALLAHEIGHHIRFPGTLQTQARLRILERTLLPFDDYSVINLFTDLMINERLGPRLKDQMVAVYQAFTHEPAFHQSGLWKTEPFFVFYLGVYEALWALEAGSLMGPAARSFARAFPNYGAESSLLAQNLFTLGPNLYTQFLYFLSIASRYLKPLSEKQLSSLDGFQCGKGEPGPEDWGAALTPSARELEAIRRAQDEGWFDADQGKRLNEARNLESRMAGLPGFGTTDATLVPEAMAAYYRQQAEAYLVHPPPQRRQGEAHTPTTLEDWEPADSPREIDWLATLTCRGLELGAASPLKRVRVAEDEGAEVPLWQARLEIYLDVSGSMPNPCLAVNAMTLAAQILALGTVRAGGRVRALLYSSQPLLFWEWTRSEAEVARFLMHYLGAGTEFPFDILLQSIQTCGEDQPIRVVITDRDFDANFKARDASREILRDASARSPRFVLLQSFVDRKMMRVYRELGATVVDVPAMQDFPRLATELTMALFPEEAHVLQAKDLARRFAPCAQCTTRAVMEPGSGHRTACPRGPASRSPGDRRRPDPRAVRGSSSRSGDRARRTRAIHEAVEKPG